MHGGRASTLMCETALLGCLGEWTWACGGKSYIVIGLSVVLR